MTTGAAGSRGPVGMYIWEQVVAHSNENYKSTHICTSHNDLCCVATSSNDRTIYTKNYSAVIDQSFWTSDSSLTY